MSTLLEVGDLRAGYGSLAVVRGLSFDVKAGEVVALLGPNGAGKTTTALTVSSMLPALAGTVKVLGRPPRGPRHAHLGIRSGLGIVLDDRGLFPSLTVRQHLLIATQRRSSAASIAWVVAILPELELLFDRKAGLLSGGEQQMLAMARALVRRPQLLVVDEMSMGLAPQVAARLGGVVRQLAAAEGLGVLLIEQHAELALSVADQVVVLEHGEPGFTGSVAELTGSHADLLQASYLGRGDAAAEAADVEGLDEQEGTGMYQVQIDRSRCEGHAKCVIECPEVFDLDDHGFGIVTGGDIAEELRPAVQRAIDGCPEYAISVSE